MLVIPVLVMWTIAIVFSLVALMPLVSVPGPVMIIIPLACVVSSIWLVARASAEPDDLPADVTPDECWKWGQFYYNPNDPSLMVEKRFGLGYTLNFAHWQCWAMLGAILAVPLAIILVVRKLS